jgi:hypothetical protein
MDAVNIDAGASRRCGACGRAVALGKGRLTRVRRGVDKVLCADCERLMAPPESLALGNSPPTGLRNVADVFPTADPHAATVELPPPPAQHGLLRSAESDRREPSSDVGPPPVPRRRRINVHLHLVLYVALAMLAGVVAGVLILAIAGNFS